MPRKIGFTVVSWSGHEENYSAKELMIHAPTVSGWRSARFCPFPQEITLQMVERCHVKKLQLLAHQYLISAKVEFHIGDRLPEPASPQNSQQLRRLGSEYVSLSNNEKTGLRARELKSVHVDAVGTYLKLTFHRNHANQYNLYNQVALVAINILGDSVDFSDVSPISSRDQLIEQYLSSTQHSSALDSSYTGSKYESISPLDDLAFDMYQDPEVAHIIRLLDDKKQDMVRLERYDLAKKLKQAIADLQKVGERLGRYDVEKHSAIEREDYDTAKEKKEQMEAYRLRVYQQLQLHDLLDITQRRPLPERPLAPRRISIPYYLSYDERPLPALRRRSGDQTQPELSPTLSPQSPRASGEPEPLSEKTQREASLPLEIYGDAVVSGAYSKTWSCREDALLAVCKRLAEVPPGLSKAELRSLMRAAIFLCRRALSDKVSSVTKHSKTLYQQTTAKHQLNTLPTNHSFKTVSLSLQEIAVYKEVRLVQLVPSELVKPIKLSLPSRLALSRLQLLEKLLEQLGFKDSGFTLENVMRFLVGALEHSAASVRELAVRLVQMMYRNHGAAVLIYLPPDDASERKTLIYKNLFLSFAKIDGKLPDPQGAREKAEIRSLQEQLAVLKEISVSSSARYDVIQITDYIIISIYPLTAGKNSPDTLSPALYIQRYITLKNTIHLCIFCGERDQAFTEEGLDLHYWKYCPMLCRCLHCRQVVEISSLTEHLLSECERRADFIQCFRCSEAVVRDRLTEHAQNCSPLPVSGSCNHCPLCHQNAAPGEEVHTHTLYTHTHTLYTHTHTVCVSSGSGVLRLVVCPALTSLSLSLSLSHSLTL
uniref:Centrosomal protein 104 n=1 Tax=Astyanax mexicanus TaxID=7994 RepID=W5LKK4_ASTMX